MLKAVAEVCSSIGYKFFPLSDPAVADSFQGNVHYALTGVIVLSYIVLSILLTVGLAKTRKYPRMTRFMILFCIVFIASGVLTAAAGQSFPQYVGLMERFNLYSLMISNIVMSLWMLKHMKVKAH